MDEDEIMTFDDSDMVVDDPITGGDDYPSDGETGDTDPVETEEPVEPRNPINAQWYYTEKSKISEFIFGEIQSYISEYEEVNPEKKPYQTEVRSFTEFINDTVNGQVEDYLRFYED